jgi:hypothetical protein
MTDTFSYKNYVRDPFLAAIEIGRLLGNSSLRLFLGAGVSSGFGLPEWKMLIARILGRDADKAYVASLDTQSVTDLRRLLDDADDQSETYVRSVHGALYREVADDLIKQLQKSPLLLAVAAMMTGAHRGRVDSVVTYNYDDLLEQYLGMLGLRVCDRVLPTELSSRADVEVNYVHGRLPQSWKAATSIPELILSEKSYRSRRAEIDEGWSSWVEHGLYSKVGLFIGLSGDDSAILDILKRTQNRVQRSEDYLGYWLLTTSAFLRNEKDIRDVGMCPIRLEKDEIPQFVFAVCQQAAAK